MMMVQLKSFTTHDIVLLLHHMVGLKSVWVVMSGSNNFKFADGVDALALGYGQTKASKL